MKNFVEELRWRGMIQDIMPETEQHLMEGLRAAYVGIDPTADSLHIGHLVGVMMLRHFQNCGHKPYALVGGATGMIGDPSGKSAERNLLTEEALAHNIQGIKKQLAKFLDFESTASNRAELVNNYDWMKGFSFLSFIRDIGKHITVNYMMAKDSVKKRFDPNENTEGMSFTEFSYQLLQGYDFLHLYQEKNVTLQMGGSDQWGNITTGTELIRRKVGGKAFALTCPLITKADGTKFGKSEGGNVWLDPEKTTPYEFYQFWLNQDDRDVIKYIKYFTFLEREEIEALEEKVATEPHKREAQIRLAEEVTRFVHGEKALEDAKKITNALFTGNVQQLTADEIEQGFKNMPTFESSKESQNLATWLVDLGIEPSRRQSREDIQNGAISINGEKVTDLEFEWTKEQSFEERFVIVRRGKKKYFLVVLK